MMLVRLNLKQRHLCCILQISNLRKPWQFRPFQTVRQAKLDEHAWRNLAGGRGTETIKNEGSIHCHVVYRVISYSPGVL